MCTVHLLLFILLFKSGLDEEMSDVETETGKWPATEDTAIYCSNRRIEATTRANNQRTNYELSRY